MGDSEISHYAILIGIDAYPDSDRPLKSCVRDVHGIRTSLKTWLHTVDIQMLTSSTTPGEVTKGLAEEQEYWPTYGNVVLALERVISRAKAGDHVYIHYSGHGTREQPVFGYSNKDTGDLALVLRTDRRNSEKLLRGPILAGFLNKMVETGLVVTLVLDCCFSGSVYRRDDPSIRYLPLDDTTASNSLSDQGESAKGDVYRANRDASMRDNWLVDPDKYAILAACGPHEVAKGLELSKNGDRHGALSYFLGEALATYGLGRKLRNIYHHICAQFRACKPEQNPVLYGNKDQGFFGDADMDFDGVQIWITESDGNLQLRAGQAHGVRDGNQFSLRPPGSSKRDLGPKDALILAKVAHVGALTSRLELLDTVSTPPKTGWIAKPLKLVDLLDMPVRLVPSLPNQEALLAALNERSFHVCPDDANFVYEVTVNMDSEYEIMDESGKTVVNIPSMPQTQTDPGDICDTLEHLARFRMVKDLVNGAPNDSFRSSFEVQVTTSDGQRAFDSSGLIEVQHGDNVLLRVKNVGTATIYVHVFDIGPCWQVKGLITSEAIPAQRTTVNGATIFSGMCSKRIKMKFPPIMDKYRSCEDVIKVIITSQPTSFDMLEIPRLYDLAFEKAGKRIGYAESQVPESWAAVNFHVRTFKTADTD